MGRHYEKAADARANTKAGLDRRISMRRAIRPERVDPTASASPFSQGDLSQLRETLSHLDETGGVAT
jgi:hypothetical protein